ncbi:hypothetical protein SCALM49S_09901 [Streptomyces californicus]
MTWSGREVATASFTSGIEEVLEARIASCRVTTWSSTWKISVMTCSFSTRPRCETRSANSAEFPAITDFDDLRDPVVLSHGPAVSSRSPLRASIGSDLLATGGRGPSGDGVPLSTSL